MMNSMTKDEMVEFLVDSDFKYIMETDGGLEFLRDILKFGHQSYMNCSEAELATEVYQRKIMDGDIGE
jgi:hypothetical protein